MFEESAPATILFFPVTGNVFYSTCVGDKQRKTGRRRLMDNQGKTLIEMGTSIILLPRSVVEPS